MAPTRLPGKPKAGGDWLFPAVVTPSEARKTSLLDVVDNVLNHGVVLHGELILGVANVDLIYAKLSLLLSAIDKLAGAQVGRSPSPSRQTRTPPKKKK